MQRWAALIGVIEMTIKSDTKGLDTLLENVQDLKQKQEVKFLDMFDPEFVSAHSQFSDLEALFAASGFKMDTKEDFEAIPDDQWDDFISENTDFESWIDMQKAGAVAYMKAQLLKGV